MIRFHDVTYTYPFQKTPAVRNLSLSVRPGEVMLVTGASGCGKSTLIRLANGLCPHFFQGELSGEIRLNGVASHGRSLQEIARDVGTVFQDPELQFFALNVDDEIAFSHEWRGRAPHEIEKIVKETGERLGISHVLDSAIHDLSEGQKQKVAIGSILSLSPSIVVLDEPSANLDPESTEELARLIAELKAAGIAVLVVDHRLYWLEGVADHVVVMAGGAIVEEGPFSILGDADLRTRHGLRSPCVEDVRDTLPPLPEEGRIRIRDLHFGYEKGTELYHGAEFSLPRGVTGIIGDNGAGKTTLARLLTGLTKMDSGTLSVDGNLLKPKEILKHSGIILQNTDHQLHMNTVLQEVSMACGLESARKAKTDDLLKFLSRFGLEHLADRHPQSLSGGEKQRLVIACGLIRNPDIFILDEPTSGLDGRNMERIAEMIRTAAEEGTSVLVITHDLELLARVCDVALRLPFPETIKETAHA